MPPDPPTTSAPLSHLWASGVRSGSSSARSRTSGTNTDVTPRSMPMSATSTSPAWPAPGWNTSPGLSAENVTVCDSKFTLVTLAAMRAREINDYYNQLGEGLGKIVPPQVTSVSRKPLSISLEEIEAGKIEAVPIPQEREASDDSEAGDVPPDEPAEA